MRLGVAGRPPQPPRYRAWALFWGALCLLAGCTRAAPESPEALAALVVRALAEGQISILAPALPTHDDYEQAAGQANVPLSATQIDAELQKMVAEIPRAFEQVRAEGEKSGLSWRDVTVGRVVAERSQRGDLSEHDVIAVLRGSEESIDEYEMRFQAMGVERGLVLRSWPRFSFGADCKRLTAHLQKLSKQWQGGSGHEQGAGYVSDAGAMVRHCRRKLEHNPETMKRRLACQLKATTLPDAMRCP